MANDIYKNLNKDDVKVRDFLKRKKFESIYDLFAIKFLEVLENTNCLLDYKLTLNATKKLLFCIASMTELKRDQFQSEIDMVRRVKENPLTKVDDVKVCTKWINFMEESFKPS